MKEVLFSSSYTMKLLISELAEKRNEKGEFFSKSESNMSRKLSTKTITFKDAHDILDIMGYRIVIMRDYEINEITGKRKENVNE